MIRCQCYETSISAYHRWGVNKINVRTANVRPRQLPSCPGVCLCVCVYVCVCVCVCACVCIVCTHWRCSPSTVADSAATPARRWGSAARRPCRQTRQRLPPRPRRPRRPTRSGPGARRRRLAGTSRPSPCRRDWKRS